MTLTIQDTDIVATQGQDLAFQVWVTDHRSEAVPFTIPARMTVKDRLGQLVFESSDDPADAGTEASVLTSPLNGLVQVTIPKAVLQDVPVGGYLYDIWATIVDPEVYDQFPGGQTVPVVSGMFHVRSRQTVMEA